MHIRSLGNWTNKLYEYFMDFSKFNNNMSFYNQSPKRSLSQVTKLERRMSNLGIKKIKKLGTDILLVHQNDTYI